MLCNVYDKINLLLYVLQLQFWFFNKIDLMYIVIIYFKESIIMKLVFFIIGFGGYVLCFDFK